MEGVRVAGVWRRNQWVSVPPRCSHSCTALRGCLYIVGGGVPHPSGSHFVHSNEVWKIDLVERTQTLLNISGFEGRRGHSAVVLHDCYIVIFGGYKTVNDQDTLSNDVVIIDTILEIIIPFLDTTYGQLPHEMIQRPPPRRGHIAAISKDKMFIMGGDHEGDLFDVDHHFVYSLTLTSVFATISGADVDYEANNNGDSQVHRSVDCFTGAWERYEIQGKLPIKLAMSAYAQSGSELLIFGGTFVNIQPLSLAVSIQMNCNIFVFDLNSFELHNISEHILSAIDDHSGSALSLSSVLTPRYGASLTVVSDKYAVIFGGSTPQGDDLSEILIIHPRTYHEKGSYEASWRRNSLHCVKSHGPSTKSSFQLPSPRNAMSLECVATRGQQSPSIVMCGGGVYPDSYYGDMWTLNLLTLPVGDIIMDNNKRKAGQVHDSDKNCVDLYFESCFADKRHSDITIYVKPNDKVEGENTQQPDDTGSGEDLYSEFRTHKIILAAKSSFFRALLDGGWAENNFGSNRSSIILSEENSLEIVQKPLMHHHHNGQHIYLDICEFPFRHVLQYIYTNVMETDVAFSSLELAADILRCSTMLGLTECTYLCEQEIVCRFLQLGQHSLESNVTNAVKVVYSLEELQGLEERAVYILSIADTFNCEHLLCASLEQVRVCRNVLLMSANVNDSEGNSSADLDGNEYSPKGLYTEYLECLSPTASARLRYMLNPSSMVFTNAKDL